MKNSYKHSLVIAVIFATLSSPDSAALGQIAPPPPAPGTMVAPGQGAVGEAAPGTVLRIRRKPRLNTRDWRQRTPVFTGSSSRSRAREWGVFEIAYDTAPEWIDELMVTFTIMAQSTDPAHKERPFSLYKLTVRYTDVPAGRDKLASAILLPSALLRYGQPIGLAVEFNVNGKVVASESVETSAILKDRWWENPAIIDSPKTVKREGYLVERGKTPFSLVNIDEFEESR